MREIKFRAFVRNYMVNVVSVDFVNKYITWDDNQYDRCVPPNKCYETESFDECILMQYTGLKANGKEIYEGDILKSESPIIRIYDNKDTGRIATSYYRIGWHQTGCWNKFEGLSDNHTGIVGITISCLKYYEVIGNIYENPELLAK